MFFLDLNSRSLVHWFRFPLLNEQNFWFGNRRFTQRSICQTALIEAWVGGLPCQQSLDRHLAREVKFGSSVSKPVLAFFAGGCFCRGFNGIYIYKYIYIYIYNECTKLQLHEISWSRPVAWNNFQFSNFGKNLEGSVRRISSKLRQACYNLTLRTPDPPPKAHQTWKGVCVFQHSPNLRAPTQYPGLHGSGLDPFTFR